MAVRIIAIYLLAINIITFCAYGRDKKAAARDKDRTPNRVLLGLAAAGGSAPKLLLSGDNSTPEYSEPDCMLAYALKQGVPREDIFLDFAGFSTYDSVYRTGAVFQAERVLVVTQKYHLFRALKICEARNITARGVASNQQKYRGRFMREAREVLARDKDLIKAELGLKPTFLGEAIPITGDGRVTQLN